MLQLGRVKISLSHVFVQGVYIYVYAISIVWMLWCTFDIIKFRQQWMQLTGSAPTQEVYMCLAERHSDTMFHFSYLLNTGGLFMRIGAGCEHWSEILTEIILFISSTLYG